MQGKNKEGLAHLERIAHIKEPEDAKSKAHYCEGLLMLSRYVLMRAYELEYKESSIFKVKNKSLK